MPERTAQDHAPITGDDLHEDGVTDIGLASLFARMNEHRLRFAGGTWFLWDTTRWQPSDPDLILQLVSETLQALRAAAESRRAPEAITAKIRSAMRVGRMKSVLELAASDPLLRRKPTDFDSDPNFVNFRNGTLDLNTFELKPHDPDQLITLRIEHSFDPTATAPRWLRFQREVTAGDEELESYKQKAYGQALLGVQPEQKAFFHLGDGANGKSVELETLKDVLGPYATTIPGEAFLKSAKSDPRNTFARLPGVRFAIGSEMDEQQPLAEGVIKSLTGGEELTARKLYRDEFTFRPMCTLFIATNHLPRVNGSDHGIRRRLVTIPFPVTFAASDQDPHLRTDLICEAQGIINWLFVGLTRYRTEGLRAPKAVRDATSRFWSQADSVGEWLQSDTTSGDDDRITAEDAYTSYRSFCSKAGITPFGRTKFGIRLSELGFNEGTGRRQQNSRGCTVYRGFSLRHQAVDPTQSVN